MKRNTHANYCAIRRRRRTQDGYEYMNIAHPTETNRNRFTGRLSWLYRETWLPWGNESSTMVRWQSRH